MDDRKAILVPGSCFCSGVRTALSEVREVLAGKDEAIAFSVHQIVHNVLVQEELVKQGMILFPDTGDVPIPPGSIMLGTAHGLGPRTRRKYEQLGCRVISTTCDKVIFLQRRAVTLATLGYHLVILGDEHHREIQSIVEWLEQAKDCGNISGSWQIIDSLDRVGQIDPAGRPIALLAQTTSSAATFEGLGKELYPIFGSIHTENTICPSVENRVENAKRVAREADMMVVVGSPESNNTQKLLEVVRVYCDKTILVLDEIDLKPRYFVGAHIVGIVGGASTDPDVAEAVKKTVEKILGIGD